MDTITNLSSDIINLILPHLSKVDAANFVLVNKSIRSALAPSTYKQLRIGADAELRELINSARTSLNIRARIALFDYLIKNRYLISINTKSMEDIVQTYVSNLFEQSAPKVLGRLGIPDPNFMYTESYILALQGRIAEACVITEFMIKMLDNGALTHREHADDILTEIYGIIDSYVFVIYCSLEYDQTILHKILEHIQTFPPVQINHFQTQFRTYGIDRKIEAFLNND